MTEQYKIRLEKDVIERLTYCARRYGRRSGNEIAGEVILQYLDLWEEAEEAKHAVIERQKTDVQQLRKRA